MHYLLCVSIGIVSSLIQRHHCNAPSHTFAPIFKYTVQRIFAFNEKALPNQFDHTGLSRYVHALFWVFTFMFDPNGKPKNESNFTTLYLYNGSTKANSDSSSCLCGTFLNDEHLYSCKTLNREKRPRLEYSNIFNGTIIEQKEIVQILKRNMEKFQIITLAQDSPRADNCNTL